MEKKLLQTSLYQKRASIKQEVRPLHLTSIQKDSIKSLIRKYSKLLKIAIWLLLIITFIEISIPLITNFYIKKYSYYLEINKLILSLVGLSGILIVYLIFSYYSIKAEKKFIIFFLNDLRRKWFSSYLNKSPMLLKGRDKGSLLTKFSFHFSLLQMGLSNALFPLINLAFLAFGLILSSLFIDTTLLIFVLISLPIIMVISFTGYIISKYYISQDQTLYSKILMYINDTFENFDTIKTRQKEFLALKQFDKMVDIDTYFRIKRELWLKYGGKIIFILISLVAASIYLIEIYYPFLKVENSAQYVVYGLFFSLIIKLFYEGLRVGLFAFPAKLGAVLCVPDEQIYSVNKPKKHIAIKTLILKSKKAKLNADGEYRKNIEFIFNKGNNYLIYGAEGGGKTSLGYILSGDGPLKRNKPWVFHVNGKRVMYNKWRNYSKSVYFISPLYKTESTLLETFISNDDSKNTSEDSIKNLTKLLNQNKYFKFLLDHGQAFGRKLSRNSLSSVENALLQFAYCLIQKPEIIIIDNMWIDINDKRINETLAALSNELKNSTIICLSTRDNNVLNYAKKYSI